MTLPMACGVAAVTVSVLESVDQVVTHPVMGDSRNSSMESALLVIETVNLENRSVVVGTAASRSELWWLTYTFRAARVGGAGVGGAGVTGAGVGGGV